MATVTCNERSIFFARADSGYIMPKPIAEHHPTEEQLRVQLGKSYAFFSTFMARQRALKPVWKYYGAKLGWSLKLLDGARNLCFINPRDGQLTIGFALGAKAVAAALESKLPDDAKDLIRNAPKYAEGRGVRIAINKAADLRAAQLLLQIKREN